MNGYRIGGLKVGSKPPTCASVVPRVLARPWPISATSVTGGSNEIALRKFDSTATGAKLRGSGDVCGPRQGRTGDDRRCVLQPPFTDEDSLRSLCREHPEEIPFETLDEDTKQMLVADFEYAKPKRRRQGGRRKRQPPEDSEGLTGAKPWC